MTPLEETVVPTKEQLLKQLKDPLATLIRERVDSNIEPEKIRQYLRARQVDLYFKGEQDLVYTKREGTIDYTSAGSPINSDSEDEDYYDYKLNIVKGDGRKLIGALGNRAPNAKAVADNPEDEQSLENSRKADTLAPLFYAWWDMRKTFRRVILKLWKAGTVFGYTPWVVDKHRYGTTTEPIYEDVDTEISPSGYQCPTCGEFSPGEGLIQCPACGGPLAPTDRQERQTSPIPRVSGEKTYDNGRPELHLFSVLHVTVPFFCETQEALPFLKLTVEEHRGRLIGIHPELRDILLETDTSEETAAAQEGRRVRTSAYNPTGSTTADKNLVTYTRVWLRPFMFNLVQDEAARELLTTQFPDGLKLTRVGTRLVDLKAERLDDVWKICQPETCDFVYGDPLAIDHIDAQDILNHAICMAVETFERAIPWMLADPSVIDFEQIRKRARRPAEVVPCKPTQGGRALHDAMQAAPVATISAEILPFASTVHDTVREVSGVQKTIFGGGEGGGDQTAREYEGRRNQAMQQLTPTWDELRGFLAGVLGNGVRQLVRYGPRTVLARGTEDNAPELVELANLEQDNWHYDIEETIPITPGQRADRVMYSFEKGVQDVLGLTHPMNIKTIHDLLGFSGLYVPGSDEIDAVKETIKQLLQEAPMQQPDGTSLPSIQPKWADDLQLIVAVTKAWCLGKVGRRTERTNPQGWENVVAYGEACEQKLIAQQAPPAPPVGPEGPISEKPVPGGPEGIPRPEVPAAA